MNRKFATHSPGPSASVQNSASGVLTLGDILEIRLGGVTGDANYFLLTESERKLYQLPLTAVKPVITKARHIYSSEISQEEWQKLIEEDERVWLFRPSLSVAEHPRVKEYLNLTKTDGGCSRDNYKIKIRDPWYRTPLPRYVDGFISGMSNYGPWISLKTMSSLSASNTLYTVRFKNIETLDMQAAWAISLLSSESRAAANARRRVYADGLIKREPKDLLRLPIIRPGHTVDARAILRDCIQRLIAGDFRTVQALADAFMSR